MIYAYLQMALALAAVLGLIFLMGFFLKKRQTSGGMMKVLAYQALGPRKGLVAVKVCNDVLLLSLTTTDIRLIKSYEADEFTLEPTVEHGGPIEKFKALKDKLL